MYLRYMNKPEDGVATMLHHDNSSFHLEGYIAAR